MAAARDNLRWLTGIPKSGTAVPNRIFVGGISGNTKEEDLTNLFSKYGSVKSTKIIVDKGGISKGYGFVTFETEEEAQKVLLEVECVTLKDRKLNIAPAFKKQPYNQSTLESNSVPSTSIVWPSQPFAGTSASFPRDSVYYPQATWPIVWPPHFYLQQQCPYPPTAQAGYPQYVYSIAPNEFPFPAMGAASGSDYSETSSADTNEAGGKNRPKPAASNSIEQDRGRSVQAKQAQPRTSSPQRFGSTSLESAANYVHSTPIHHLHHPVFAKTVNGVTVMTYPSSFVMGSPAIVHVKDGNGESENVMTEVGFLHSSITSGNLTPPPTPMASLSCDFN